MAIKNPTIEVVGKYINAKTKITHHCLIHDVYWDIDPDHLLKKGHGCKECGKKAFRQVRAKTHHQYIKEVEEINPNIEVIEEYISNKTPILHHCKKHNILWKTIPDSILRGQGCLECRKDKISSSKTKSHERYAEELSKKNPNIIVVDMYANALTPILHKCKIDGYEWNAQPSNVLFGTGCPKCAGKIQKTHKDYVYEVSIINPDIEVLGKYIDSKTPILHKCKIHDIQWETSPCNILRRHGCLECKKEKIRIKNNKTHEQYVHEVSVINSDIKVIGTYINARTPILHRCLRDGYEWNTLPDNILNGTGCPRCNESSGERKIRQLLDQYTITYEYQKTFSDCRDIRTLPFDFYLPDYNLCIEYDGEQHYKPIAHFGGNEAFERMVKHDNIKNEYCKNNGISLLRIPYFKNVEEELNNFLFI